MKKYLLFSKIIFERIEKIIYTVFCILSIYTPLAILYTPPLEILKIMQSEISTEIKKFNKMTIEFKNYQLGFKFYFQNC